MIATTRSGESVPVPTLYVALEVSAKTWKLALAPGLGVPPWVRTIARGDGRALDRVLAAARRRFGLALDARVVSCYEAGRDGFWIHRALEARGIRNRVVDSASIEVNRRARRAKTDRLDALKLVTMLLRVAAGEHRVWAEVHVPSVAAEAARHLSRERTQLTQEHTRVINQLRGWLATWGAGLPRQRASAWWTTVRAWDGTPVPEPVQQRLARAHARLQQLEAQIAELEATQRTAVAGAPPDAAVRRLQQLKGVGTTSALALSDEGLTWRAFQNRRQVGGLLGFVPVPYRSGDLARDQGINRAGNRRWRALLIQLAWGWVRWQPASALTQWFHRRFAAGGARARRIGIVAVARKLLIALWRWATAGILPAGAVLKAA
jgi:transposase